MRFSGSFTPRSRSQLSTVGGRMTLMAAIAIASSTTMTVFGGRRARLMGFKANTAWIAVAAHSAEAQSAQSVLPLQMVRTEPAIVKNGRNRASGILWITDPEGRRSEQFDAGSSGRSE